MRVGTSSCEFPSAEPKPLRPQGFESVEGFGDSCSNGIWRRRQEAGEESKTHALERNPTSALESIVPPVELYPSETVRDRKEDDDVRLRKSREREKKEGRDQRSSSRNKKSNVGLTLPERLSSRTPT